VGESNPWIEILVAWLPMIILLAVWGYFMWRSRGIYMGRSGKTHGQMLEEHIAEMRRQNDLLEKLVKDQEARIQRLEVAREQLSGSSSGGG
jgi:ATP-dependent Zn protease